MVGRVDGDEAGDADGAWGGKKRIDQAYFHAGVNGYRQQKKNGSEQNHCGKAKRNDAARGLFREK